MEFQLTRSSPIISRIASLASRAYEQPLCSPDIAGMQTQIIQATRELRDALEYDMGVYGNTVVCPPCPTVECPPPITCPPPQTCPSCPPCTPNGQPIPPSAPPIPTTPFTPASVREGAWRIGQRIQQRMTSRLPFGGLTMADLMANFPSGTKIILYGSNGESTGEILLGQDYGNGITISECDARKVLAAKYPARSEAILNAHPMAKCP